MSKKDLGSLTVAELQENCVRIQQALEDLGFCLENLEEERDELVAANQMFKETLVGLGEKVQDGKGARLKTMIRDSRERIETGVKKIIDSHLTPKGFSLFKSVSVGQSPMMGEKNKDTEKGSPQSRILPKAKRFFASPGRFLINKLKRLS